MKANFKSSSARIRYTVCIAVFTALAYVVSVLTGFIKVQFLTFDAKDCIIAVGALSLGPIAGAITAALVALLEFLLSSTTGIYGLIMNFISSATFSVTASLIYRARRTYSFAVFSLISAVFATTGGMLLANYLITPFYMGVPRAVVVDLLLPLLLPFNLIKTALNAALTLLLYKHITYALSRADLIQKQKSVSFGVEKSATKGKAFPLRTVIVSTVAILVLAGGVLLYFLVLDAKITLPWN